MIASVWESTANASYDAQEMQVAVNIIYLFINIIYIPNPRISPQQLLHRTPRGSVTNTFLQWAIKVPQLSHKRLPTPNFRPKIRVNYDKASKMSQCFIGRLANGPRACFRTRANVWPESDSLHSSALFYFYFFMYSCRLAFLIYAFNH